MFRALAMSSLLLACPLWASALAAQSAPPRLQPTPAAQELFERDWVLMNWALKFFDRDRDILLEPGEAAAAAAEFRKIADADGDILLEPNEAEAAAQAFRKLADSNHDGRVTPDEYRAARGIILARY